MSSRGRSRGRVYTSSSSTYIPGRGKDTSHYQRGTRGFRTFRPRTRFRGRGRPNFSRGRGRGFSALDDYRDRHSIERSVSERRSRSSERRSRSISPLKRSRSRSPLAMDRNLSDLYESEFDFKAVPGVFDESIRVTVDNEKALGYARNAPTTVSKIKSHTESIFQDFDKDLKREVRASSREKEYSSHQHRRLEEREQLAKRDRQEQRDRERRAELDRQRHDYRTRHHSRKDSKERSDSYDRHYYKDDKGHKYSYKTYDDRSHSSDRSHSTEHFKHRKEKYKSEDKKHRVSQSPKHDIGSRERSVERDSRSSSRSSSFKPQTVGTDSRTSKFDSRSDSASKKVETTTESATDYLFRIAFGEQDRQKSLLSTANSDKTVLLSEEPVSQPLHEHASSRPVSDSDSDASPSRIVSHVGETAPDLPSTESMQRLDTSDPLEKRAADKDFVLPGLDIEEEEEEEEEDPPVTLDPFSAVPNLVDVEDEERFLYGDEDVKPVSKKKKRKENDREHRKHPSAKAKPKKEQDVVHHKHVKSSDLTRDTYRGDSSHQKHATPPEVKPKPNVEEEIHYHKHAIPASLKTKLHIDEGLSSVSQKKSLKSEFESPSVGDESRTGSDDIRHGMDLGSLTLPLELGKRTRPGSSERSKYKRHAGEERYISPLEKSILYGDESVENLDFKRTDPGNTATRPVAIETKTPPNLSTTYDDVLKFLQHKPAETLSKTSSGAGVDTRLESHQYTIVHPSLAVHNRQTDLLSAFKPRSYPSSLPADHDANGSSTVNIPESTVPSATVADSEPKPKESGYDPTIQNILKSIGFNFELSKLSQDKAKRDREQQDPKTNIDTYGINQASTFLAGGLKNVDFNSLFDEKNVPHPQTMPAESSSDGCRKDSKKGVVLQTQESYEERARRYREEQMRAYAMGRESPTPFVDATDRRDTSTEHQERRLSPDYDAQIKAALAKPRTMSPSPTRDLEIESIYGSQSRTQYPSRHGLVEKPRSEQVTPDRISFSDLVDPEKRKRRLKSRFSSPLSQPLDETISPQSDRWHRSASRDRTHTPVEFRDRGSLSREEEDDDDAIKRIRQGNITVTAHSDVDSTKDESKRVVSIQVDEAQEKKHHHAERAAYMEVRCERDLFESDKRKVVVKASHSKSDDRLYDQDKIYEDRSPDRNTKRQFKESKYKIDRRSEAEKMEYEKFIRHVVEKDKHHESDRYERRNSADEEKRDNSNYNAERSRHESGHSKYEDDGRDYGEKSKYYGERSKHGTEKNKYEGDREIDRKKFVEERKDDGGKYESRKDKYDDRSKYDEEKRYQDEKTKDESRRDKYSDKSKYDDERKRYEEERSKQESRKETERKYDREKSGYDDEKSRSEGHRDKYSDKIKYEEEKRKRREEEKRLYLREKMKSDYDKHKHRDRYEYEKSKYGDRNEDERGKYRDNKDSRDDGRKYKHASPKGYRESEERSSRNYRKKEESKSPRSGEAVVSSTGRASGRITASEYSTRKLSRERERSREDYPKSSSRSPSPKKQRIEREVNPEDKREAQVAAAAAKINLALAEQLTPEMAQRQKRLRVLENELERLRKSQNELMRKKQRMKDGHKDPLLLENNKLQEEISLQISSLRKTAGQKQEVDRQLVDPQIVDRHPELPEMKLASIPLPVASTTFEESFQSKPDKGSNERKVAEKKVAEKKVAEKKVAEKKVAEKKVAEKKHEEKKDAEKKVAEKKVAEKKIAEQKVAEKKVAEKKVVEKKTEEKKVAEKKQPEVKEVKEKPKKVTFEYFDPGNHWCKQCNEVYTEMTQYLEHMHSKSHLQATAPHDRPWIPDSLRCPTPKPLSTKGGLLPIKGVEFLMAAEAFYCSLCRVFSGDPLCAEDHLKSKLHNEKYQDFVAANTSYEQKLSVDKAIGMRDAAADARKKRESEKKRYQDETEEKRASKRQKFERQSAEARAQKMELKRSERETAVAALDDVSGGSSTVADVSAEAVPESVTNLPTTVPPPDPLPTPPPPPPPPPAEPPTSTAVVDLTSKPSSRFSIKFTGKSSLIKSANPLDKLLRNKKEAKPFLAPPKEPAFAQHLRKKLKQERLLEPHEDEPAPLDQFLTIGTAKHSKSLPVVKEEARSLTAASLAEAYSTKFTRPATAVVTSTSAGQAPAVVSTEMEAEMKMLGIEPDSTSLSLPPKPPPSLALSNVKPKTSMCASSATSLCSAFYGTTDLSASVETVTVSSAIPAPCDVQAVPNVANQRSSEGGHIPEQSDTPIDISEIELPQQVKMIEQTESTVTESNRGLVTQPLHVTDQSATPAAVAEQTGDSSLIDSSVSSSESGKSCDKNSVVEIKELGTAKTIVDSPSENTLVQNIDPVIQSKKDSTCPVMKETDIANNDKNGRTVSNVTEQSGSEESSTHSSLSATANSEIVGDKSLDPLDQPIDGRGSVSAVGRDNVVALDVDVNNIQLPTDVSQIELPSEPRREQTDSRQLLAETDKIDTESVNRIILPSDLTQIALPSEPPCGKGTGQLLIAPKSNTEHQTGEAINTEDVCKIQLPEEITQGDSPQKPAGTDQILPATDNNGEHNKTVAMDTEAVTILIVPVANRQREVSQESAAISEIPVPNDISQIELPNVAKEIQKQTNNESILLQTGSDVAHDTSVAMETHSVGKIRIPTDITKIELPKEIRADTGHICSQTDSDADRETDVAMDTTTMSTDIGKTEVNQPISHREVESRENILGLDHSEVFGSDDLVSSEPAGVGSNKPDTVTNESFESTELDSVTSEPVVESREPAPVSSGPVAVVDSSEPAPVSSVPAENESSEPAPVSSVSAVLDSSKPAPVCSEPAEVVESSEPAPVSSEPAENEASELARVSSEPAVLDSSEPAPVSSEPVEIEMSEPAPVSSEPAEVSESSGPSEALESGEPAFVSAEPAHVLHSDEPAPISPESAEVETLKVATDADTVSAEAPVEGKTSGFGNSETTDQISSVMESTAGTVDDFESELDVRIVRGDSRKPVLQSTEPGVKEDVATIKTDAISKQGIETEQSTPIAQGNSQEGNTEDVEVSAPLAEAQDSDPAGSGDSEEANSLNVSVKRDVSTEAKQLTEESLPADGTTVTTQGDVTVTTQGDVTMTASELSADQIGSEIETGLMSQIENKSSSAAGGINNDGGVNVNVVSPVTSEINSKKETDCDIEANILPSTAFDDNDELKQNVSSPTEQDVDSTGFLNSNALEEINQFIQLANEGFIPDETHNPEIKPGSSGKEKETEKVEKEKVSEEMASPEKSSSSAEERQSEDFSLEAAQEPFMMEDLSELGLGTCGPEMFDLPVSAENEMIEDLGLTRPRDTGLFQPEDKLAVVSSGQQPGDSSLSTTPAPAIEDPPASSQAPPAGADGSSLPMQIVESTTAPSLETEQGADSSSVPVPASVSATTSSPELAGDISSLPVQTSESTTAPSLETEQGGDDLSLQVKTSESATVSSQNSELAGTDLSTAHVKLDTPPSGVPETATASVSCKCKGGCQTMRCACKKAGIQCAHLCHIGWEMNCLNQNI